MKDIFETTKRQIERSAIKPLSIKVDETLKIKLKQAAKQDNRSLHGYILNLLKKLHEPKN